MTRIPQTIAFFTSDGEDMRSVHGWTWCGLAGRPMFVRPIDPERMP